MYSKLNTPLGVFYFGMTPGDKALTMLHMARTRSITSINKEIQKIEDELTKVRDKREELESKLLELQNAKQEIEAKQIMDAFKKSGKSMHELMVFLEG